MCLICATGPSIASAVWSARWPPRRCRRPALGLSAANSTPRCRRRALSRSPLPPPTRKRTSPRPSRRRTPPLRRPPLRRRPQSRSRTRLRTRVPSRRLSLRIPTSWRAHSEETRAPTSRRRRPSVQCLPPCAAPACRPADACTAEGCSKHFAASSAMKLPATSCPVRSFSSTDYNKR